ncbi:putative metalloprotease CJM1_0395 family protein [Halopseudomonas salegens]|uniref:SprA-related family protein n=1 Tax=Halopseudomonas salegens TaxID=1434072 RepID=A0A1H2EAM7_9GAMM|nr:putative metalloprotease CJM1_0395 family protein [Halopseudomonas salegens]SDT92172.1 SprA-related family protein [Halopseudomonas salegens]
MLLSAALSGAVTPPSYTARQPDLPSVSPRVPDAAVSAVGVSGQAVSNRQAISPAGVGTSSASSPPTNTEREGDGDAEAARAAELEQRAASAEAEMQRLLQQEIRTLAQRDREVRAHEQSHLAVGGQYAGPVSYDFQRGPDGRQYAVGGSVAIDVSPVANNPEATLQKMQQVQRAALAPAEPSPQDLAVAAQAAQQAAASRAELAQESLSTDADDEDDSASAVSGNADADDEGVTAGESSSESAAADRVDDSTLRSRSALASYQSAEQGANLSSLLDLRA